MSLPEHLERFLGPIREGWSGPEVGLPPGLSVARFAGPPEWHGSVEAYATLGLSRLPLRAPGSPRVYRLELLILVDAGSVGKEPGHLLATLSAAFCKSRRAILRGEVISDGSQLLTGTAMTALYASKPVYLPDDFAVASTEDGDTVIVWLVPITAREADYVSTHGWAAFETMLERGDTALTDPYRPALLV